MRILPLLILVFATALNAGEAVPLGHPDFYPSPQRPLGWRGDGTGAWPGANVVTSWDAASGKNVAWKVNTPGAGLCQPLVIGEKVVITADPHLLCCYSVHDGKLLWQTAIDHTLCMNEADRKAAREEQAFWDGKWRKYIEWRDAIKKLEEGILKIAGVGASPDPKKDKTAFEKWQKSRADAIGALYYTVSSFSDSPRLVEPGDPGYAAALTLVKDNAASGFATPCPGSFDFAVPSWVFSFSKGVCDPHTGVDEKENRPMRLPWPSDPPKSLCVRSSTAPAV